MSQITLAQVAEAIANATGVLLNDDVLNYPSVDPDQPSLFFSWLDADGDEYQINIEEKHVVSIKQKDKLTIEITYSDDALGQESVEIKILNPTEFNFN